MTTIPNPEVVAKKVQELWTDNSLPGKPWSLWRSICATFAAIEMPVPSPFPSEEMLMMGRRIGWSNHPETVIATLLPIAPGIVLFYPTTVYTGDDALLDCPPHQSAGLVRRRNTRSHGNWLYDVIVFGEKDHWKARIYCCHAYSRDRERVPNAFVRFTMDDTTVVMSKTRWNELDAWLKKWLPENSDSTKLADPKAGMNEIPFGMLEHDF
jgi:hypothetical protein